jgi:hypothetical protein
MLPVKLPAKLPVKVQPPLPVKVQAPLPVKDQAPLLHLEAPILFPSCSKPREIVLDVPPRLDFLTMLAT